jgi:2-dehydropantoate 2-reductase
MIYYSTAITEPGVIDHLEGTRIAIGEPGGTKSDRCREIAETGRQAGASNSSD